MWPRSARSRTIPTGPEDDDSYSYATAFTTGPNPTGCTFGSIDLYMDGDPGVAAAVALHASANNRGYKPGAKLADLRLSGPFDNDISIAEAWTGPVGLAPNTTSVVVVSEDRRRPGRHLRGGRPPRAAARPPRRAGGPSGRLCGNTIAAGGSGPCSTNDDSSG